MSDTGTPHHSGDAALEVVRGYGVDVMFTLNGGHVWPLYDAAVKQDVRIVDVRHEQTATFAAEGWAKLTRHPGLAVLTAGPGVTNGVSAITTAHFNGTPLVVLGGRAPQARWGSGSLQELDHVPIVASITKSARTVTAAGDTAKEIQHAVTTAMTPHRGPVFVDFPMDVIFGSATAPEGNGTVPRGVDPDPADVERAAALIAAAESSVAPASIASKCGNHGACRTASRPPEQAEAGHPARHCIAVRAIGGHRVVCISDRDDPGQQGNLSPVSPSGYPCPSTRS